MNQQFSVFFGGKWGKVGLLFLGFFSINYHFFLAVPSATFCDVAFGVRYFGNFTLGGHNKLPESPNT